MKFKKNAKDITGRLIQEGDIFLYPDNHDMVDSVVVDIKQHDRDTPPDVIVKKVTKDWVGRVTGTKRAVLTVDVYKRGRILYPSLLRDDVPAHAKVKELREQVMEKVLNV